MHIIYVLSLLAAAVCNFVIIGILLKRKEKSTALISFIILLFLINIWAVPQIIINVFGLRNEIFVDVDKISALGYSFIPVAFFIFSLAFTSRLVLLRNYFVIALVFVVPIIFLYFAWNTNLIEVRDFSKVLPSDWGYPVPTGEFFKFLILWFDGVNLFSLTYIIDLYRTTVDKRKKKQALWIIIAVLIPLTFGTITNGILPALHVHLFPSAIPLTSIMAVVIAYAMFRHELFEPNPVTLLSSIGNGMITVDKDGRILLANPVALHMLGLRMNTLTGKKFFEVIALQKKKNQAITYEDKFPLQNVLKSGESMESSDFFMHLTRRKQMPVECTITAIIQNNQIKGATLIFRDITKEKELEISKNQFIGIASHELKTPLTSIKGFSQLLEKRLRSQGETQDHYFITSINKQLDKIMILINELLDMNRIDSGKYILNKKKCDIDELIDRIVKDIQYTSSDHAILVEGKVKKILNIDEEKVGQVLINLITNAVKYSPNADKVVVNVEEKDKDVLVSVRDFGIGIPKTDQKKIFGRFYRTKISRESNIVGFGLGLSICAENIKRHSGKIWVKSKERKGSTFFFTLPL